MALFGAGIVFTYVTNPFTSFTVVRKPYETEMKPNGQIMLVQLSSPAPHTASFYKDVAWVTSGLRIVNNVYTGGKKSNNQDVEHIIDDIHNLRFDSKNPYLISGDHFSQLFPRSLGIFYASLLDPRTARSYTDWLNRQTIYLKTTAYALDVVARTQSLPTTIVPLGGNNVTTLNIYHPASDTLYSLLYGLRVMMTSEDLETLYPFPPSSPAVLQTRDAAGDLLHQYGKSLTALFRSYNDAVYDKKTGLVRTDILLSGTKDVTKRQSSFYDNVIFWKTNQLAQTLSLIPQDPGFLQSLKARILETFWLPQEGHFLDDLSREGKTGKWYSSDWLIVLMSGFLDPKNSTEQHYFTDSVSYIQKHHLDEPFGLKFQEENRANRQYFLPRVFAPDYGGTAIWSNWGMEYTKLLAILYDQTSDPSYLVTAKKQIDAYAKNIVIYRGYPEVYAASGVMFKNLIYKSVRQTGWVVSFEQARALVHSVSEHQAL